LAQFRHRPKSLPGRRLLENEGIVLAGGRTTPAEEYGHDMV